MEAFERNRRGGPERTKPTRGGVGGVSKVRASPTARKNTKALCLLVQARVALHNRGRDLFYSFFLQQSKNGQFFKWQQARGKGDLKLQATPRTNTRGATAKSHQSRNSSTAPFLFLGCKSMQKSTRLGKCPSPAAYQPPSYEELTPANEFPLHAHRKRATI